MADKQIIYLIHHGESEANIGLPTSDFENIPLTPRGHAQALSLISVLPRPKRIFVSPLLRARQTLAPLSVQDRNTPSIASGLVGDIRASSSSQVGDNLLDVALVYGISHARGCKCF